MNAKAAPDDPDDEARRLAEEILARLADGEAVDIPAKFANLPEEERRRGLQLVEDAQRAWDVLPRALRVGTVLGGRFRLVRELGAGGMGRVFEAEDRKLGRLVAVKVLTALGRENFDPEQQFLKEARVLASLQHPNIVAVHELGTHDGHAFLVMDLVDGTPLGDVLAHVREVLRDSSVERPRDGALLLAAIGRPAAAGRLTPPAGDDWFHACARVALELARTLATAHARGIVHRDIKPQNVLLRGDATPVVLDFGLAGMLDHEQGSLTQGLFGTVAYLAPEQVTRGRTGVDPRSDVYQLGLLLYEMLTLQRAFPGADMSELLMRIGRGEFLRPRTLDRGIPVDLEAVCLKAMELDPARRYASLAALREDLQRWVEEDLPPRAARGGPVAAALRNGRYFVRRHRMSVIVACLVIALAATWLLLRPASRWTGELLAIRMDAHAQVKAYPDFISVQPGDTLGVIVRADSPAYVYALSIFGRESPHDWVRPLALKIKDGVRQSAADRWGFLVDPGVAAAYSRIEPGTPRGQHEGLLVFASAERQPWIEDWLDSLDWLGRDAPGGCVTYEAAGEALTTARAQRGGQVTLTPLEQAALQNFHITPDAVLGSADWPIGGPVRWMQSFSVEPRGS